MSKYSGTGLMNQQPEVHRLENLFYKQQGSAYYLPKYGLDWDFFLNSQSEIPIGSFLSYMNQRAFQQGIVILDEDFAVEDFTLGVRVKLLDEEMTLTRGI